MHNKNTSKDSDKRDNNNNDNNNNNNAQIKGTASVPAEISCFHVCGQELVLSLFSYYKKGKKNRQSDERKAI